MTCTLCGGTKIVHTEVSAGIMTVGPCPNCTNFIHKQYEQDDEKRYGSTLNFSNDWVRHHKPEIENELGVKR